MNNNWEIKKLFELSDCEIIMGQSPPSDSYNDKNGVPFLQGKTEFGYIFPKPIKFTSEPIKISERSDILISVRAPVGDVNIAPFRLCIGRGLAAIRFSKNDSRFFFYWFQFKKDFIERQGMGSTFKAITINQINNLEVSIPLLPEQKAIAEILSTVDDAIQKSDEVINRTECIKSAVMKKLLSEGIGHTEFNETKLGKIPKEWQVVKLNEVGIFQYGYTASSQIEDTGTKFLRITDIDERGNVNWEEVPYCKISNQEFSKYKLYNKDILFARIGATSGKTCIIENAPTSIFASYLIRLKTNKDIYPKFLFFFTQSNFYWKQALQNREGQLKKGLNANTISNFEIQLPNLNEQKEIADIFSEIDKKVKVENIRKEKLLRIKKSLMNDLLTGKKDIGKIENLINSYK